MDGWQRPTIFLKNPWRAQVENPIFQRGHAANLTTATGKGRATRVAHVRDEDEPDEDESGDDDSDDDSDDDDSDDDPPRRITHGKSRSATPRPFRTGESKIMPATDLPANPTGGNPVTLQTGSQTRNTLTISLTPSFSSGPVGTTSQNVLTTSQPGSQTRHPLTTSLTPSTSTSSKKLSPSSHGTVSVGVIIGALLLVTVILFGAGLFAFFRGRRRLVRSMIARTSGHQETILEPFIAPDTGTQAYTARVKAIPSISRRNPFPESGEKNVAAGPYSHRTSIEQSAPNVRYGGRSSELTDAATWSRSSRAREVDAGPILTKVEVESNVEDTLPPKYRDVFNIV